MFYFKATLYPGNKLSFSLFKSILNNAYWPIYGEMKILDNLDSEECAKDNELSDCPEQSGIAFSYIALMIYMVIANVLLINLLIAMFRYAQRKLTFVKIKTHKLKYAFKYLILLEKLHLSGRTREHGQNMEVSTISAGI
jgi:hypothetical protein